MEPCRLDSCVHYSKKGRLGCDHKEYSKQDVRPGNPMECKLFDTRLELVLRAGKHFIRNAVNGIEVEYKRGASAFSVEGSKILDAMARQLGVRRKDVYARCLAIPEVLPKDITFKYIKERKVVIFKRGKQPVLPVKLHILESASGRKRTAASLDIDVHILDRFVAHIIEKINEKPPTKKREKKKAPIIRAELPTSEKVSDIFAYSGDRKFNSRIQIKSLGFPKSRFTDVTFSCHYQEDCTNAKCRFKGFKMNFQENFNASAMVTYFDSNNPGDIAKVLAQKGLAGIPQGCDKVWVEGKEETAITQAIVSDLAGNEAKAWFIHSDQCDLRRSPNWIVSKGWLCRGKYGRIGVLVLQFKSEAEVMKPSKKTVEESKTYLQGITGDGEPTVWKVARALHRKSNLKGKETTRGFVSDLLNNGAPIWTKTPEGPKTLAMTSVEIGGTTTAKSQRTREIIDWLKAGKYESGKKTSAGLAAGAEKIEGMGWVMRKGLLPSADLSFIILDNMFPHALDAFIESRRNGIIMLSTIKACELWARTRLKLLSNPTIPLDQHLHKCVALKVYDPKFIARFTFVTFTYGVDAQTRYNPEIQTLTEEDQSILNATWNVLRWNLSQEVTYTVPLELWPKIMDLSKKLELKFGNEEIPLFLRANPHKIATLAYCFALFEGVEQPGERHVDQAYEWLEQCGVDIELDEFTAQWKQEHRLSNGEYKEIANTITVRMAEEMRESGGGLEENTLAGFLNYVARHGEAQMEEIAASLNVGNRAVKSRARELKGLGLIRSSRKGYFFTAKGVRFYKRWLKEHSNGEPDAPDALDSKGHPLSEEKKRQNLHNFSAKDSVTPKNGFNGCIEFNIKTVLSVEPLNPGIHGKCPCGSKEDNLPFRVNLKDGTHLEVCLNCGMDLKDKLEAKTAGPSLTEDTMVAVKSWCTTHRNERSEINLADLTHFIKKELKQPQPHHVVAKAFADSILMRHPTKSGWAIVV